MPLAVNLAKNMNQDRFRNVREFLLNTLDLLENEHIAFIFGIQFNIEVLQDLGNEEAMR